MVQEYALGQVIADRKHTGATFQTSCASLFQQISTLPAAIATGLAAMCRALCFSLIIGYLNKNFDQGSKSDPSILSTPLDIFNQKGISNERHGHYPWFTVFSTIRYPSLISTSTTRKAPRCLDLSILASHCQAPYCLVLYPPSLAQQDHQ